MKFIGVEAELTELKDKRGNYTFRLTFTHHLTKWWKPGYEEHLSRSMVKGSGGSYFYLSNGRGVGFEEAAAIFTCLNVYREKYGES